jgi:hypothetical protein
MCGILTGWLNEWVKMRYLSTTEDVLNFFNKIIPLYLFSPKTFLGKSLLHLSFGPNGVSREIIKNIKLKVYQYFYFSDKLRNNFHTMRYVFKSLHTASGESECTGLVKDTKLANVESLSPKKAPKYSKNLEVVNSSSLTTRIEIYLKKKALA